MIFMRRFGFFSNNNCDEKTCIYVLVGYSMRFFFYFDCSKSSWIWYFGIKQNHLIPIGLVFIWVLNFSNPSFLLTLYENQEYVINTERKVLFFLVDFRLVPTNEVAIMSVKFTWEKKITGILLKLDCILTVGSFNLLHFKW